MSFSQETGINIIYCTKYIMFSDKDYSYYDGIPKTFRNIRDKEFAEWEIPPWELLINKQKILGEGEFGTVYSADWRKTEVAAKVINNNIPEHKKSLFIREFDAMTKVHHPNIVQLLGYVNEPFIIVMEYLPEGNLLSYWKKNKLTVSDKVNIMKDILKGLAYMHNRRPNYIIHRDIKPQNILITPSGRAKIGDFGLSRIINYATTPPSQSVQKQSTEFLDLLLIEKKNPDLTNTVGTERYMSPEMKSLVQYNYKTDIWSCGIISSELFEEVRYNEHTFKWRKTPIPIISIISQCMLREKPSDRFSATEIISEIEKMPIDECNCMCTCINLSWFYDTENCI